MVNTTVTTTKRQAEYLVKFTIFNTDDKNLDI